MAKECMKKARSINLDAWEGMDVGKNYGRPTLPKLGFLFWFFFFINYHPYHCCFDIYSSIIHH